MTRGAVVKRPRLGNTSPITQPVSQLPASLPYPSRPFPAPSHPVNGTTTAPSAPSTKGPSASATISNARPVPPQLQHQLPAPQQYHSASSSTQDIHRSPPSLSLNKEKSSAKGQHPNAAAGLIIATSQHPAPLGAIPAPSPGTGPSSASFPPPHLDHYQQSGSHQQSAPLSATQSTFPPNQPPNATLPPLSSPAVIATPGTSASAPPFPGHPHRPPPEYYAARGPYPGPQPPFPPGTPTTASFVPHQQSAPIGAPPPNDAMMMDHPPPHHHPAYGHGPHPGEQGANGAAHHLSHPNGPPPYQPVQPVEQYGGPAPNPVIQGYPGPQMQPTSYQYATAPAAPPPSSSQQKASSVKKHTRAHVACNACRGRKQKCDEQVPSCSYCLTENITCEYRQVQPPKADRNLATLQDAQLKFDSELKSMRKDIAAILQLIKSQHEPSSTNGDGPTRRESAGLNSEQTEEFESVQEQAPGAHSTGAQHLSKKFPVTEPWFRAAGVQNVESYPYELEQRRGTPRIFGTGWSGDDASGRNERNTFYNNSFRGSHEKKNKGGLNPNGSLRLDPTTVKKYYDSYMRNMWVIYPIFNADELKQRVLAFCAMYSPDEDVKPGTPPHAYYSAQSPHASSNLKRSFSEMQGDADDPGHCGDPKRPVDASINNAVILLILAIGKLCEHDKFIMSEDLIGRIDPFPEDAGSQGSSPHYARPSSTRSTNSSASPKFPNNIMNMNAQCWQDIYVPPNSKNVYKLPGLAYYAEAASILGQTMGHRGMDAVHAYILAGLYWGQLGHVLQSADWIHMAANSVVELLYSLDPKDITIPADVEQVRSFNQTFQERPVEERNRINSFLIAFWTVQQMEGDILAELERLPTSRLGSHLQIDGKQMAIPHGLVGVSSSNLLFFGSFDTTHVFYHFLCQLTLRKYLNRAHLALYGTQEQQREAALGRQRTLTWGDLNPQELWQTVQTWRNSLPEALKWSDDEPPSNDILQARLRAKYYGFVYIVSRKVLEEVTLTSAPFDPADYERVRNLTLEELRKENTQSTAAGCKRCILSAMASTIAFDNTCDGTRKRAMLPNIMGTFTAQFSNMLVLSYCFVDQRLRELIPSEDEIVKLLQRTIRLLHNLSPLSPVFATNKNVLLKAYEAVRVECARSGIKVELPLIDPRTNNSAITNNNWGGSPATYGSPGVQSAGRSSQGPGTPAYDHHITSAHTSFNAAR